MIELVQACSVHLKSSNPVWLPRQDEFRNFCMSDETEKVYQRLEAIIGIC
jgi:hypothetical protein